MSEKCSQNTCIQFDKLMTKYADCIKCAAHKADLTSAGQVGSSGLLVAREGDQQRDTTASQLGPLVARIDVIDESGGEHKELLSTFEYLQILWPYRNTIKS